MQSLFDAVKSLIQALTGGRRAVAATVAELEQAGRGDPVTALPLLHPYLFGRSAAIADAAAEAIHTLLCSVAPLDLLSSGALRAWVVVHPGDSEQLATLAAERLAAAARKPSGARLRSRTQQFSRERLRPRAGGSAARSTGRREELPYLLLRLNDWVVTIRQFAKAAVLVRLTDGSGQGVVDNLPLLFHLAECRRADLSWLTEVIGQHFGREENLEVLTGVIRGQDRKRARLCLRGILDRPSRHRAAAIRAALTADDSVVRTWATTRLAEAESGEALSAALALRERDGSPPVWGAALAVCGSAGKCVAVVTKGAKYLQVDVAVTSEAEGRRLAEKIFEMAELAPYEVDLRFDLRP